jgi:hypothetical protein
MSQLGFIKREIFAFRSKWRQKFCSERLFTVRVIWSMGERATARLFGWSLGGLFFAMLTLNALFR